ncbi:MAG: nickel pincer cofactor biosynthesis protein LarC [Nitrospirota bacterium]
MKTAYFDCFSGISGDMTLGALVDAGMSIEVLRAELAKLNLSGYEIKAEQVKRSGIAATKVHVIINKQDHQSRHLSDIVNLIGQSSLSPTVKQKSINIFNRLADAEAKVHGTSREQIHFHEVGALDSIIDIVGSVIGLEYHALSQVITSAINVGSGTVQTSHGTFPIPAPATAELLRDIPCYASSQLFELTTPTGAALVSTLGSSFGLLPNMKIDRIAYGAGDKDFRGSPNVLRLMIGELAADYTEDTSSIIETAIDDMNPQIYDSVIQKMLDQGAQDAYLTPIIMKKGRPGILLTVLADASKIDSLLDILFRETTSIGARMHSVERKKLQREIRSVETQYGTIRMKVSMRGNAILTVTPEYEDCRAIAEKQGTPIKQLMEEAKALFFSQREDHLKSNKE